MEISQAFTTCIPALPPFIQLIAPEIPPLWIDLLKTLIATFIGAGLAFCTNFYFQHRQRISDQRTAGNIALATLSRQYGDFVIAKAAVETELNRAQSANPQTPLWRALKPTLLEFESDLLFDFKSLAFIVADGSDILFASLVSVETNYHDLRRILERHSKAASQLQYKFSAANWPNLIIPSEEEAQRVAGQALVGELNSITQAIAIRVTTHETMYEKAGSQLETLMRTKFKDRVFAFRALNARMGLLQLDGGNAKPK